VSRLDWSRPLPRPLTIPTVMKLSTLADVRDLVEKHLPDQNRRKPAWRHVSTEIAKAAEGEKDLLEICVSLRLVLALEGVECLMNRNSAASGRTYNRVGRRPLAMSAIPRFADSTRTSPEVREGPNSDIAEKSDT
jgi:hypothetical protein